MSKREPGPFSLGERVQMSGTVKKVHDGARTEFVEAQLPYKLSYERRKIELPAASTPAAARSSPGAPSTTSGGGNEFRPDIGEAKRVWMVMFDLHRKPVMCFDHQLESAEEASDV